MNERMHARGPTTGTCAAAAAKGAAMALFTGLFPSRVEIRLPEGESMEIPILSLSRKRWASCCKVRKKKVERGDVTGGLVIAAVCRRTCGNGVLLRGGRGVGVVTKPGLEISIGDRAINPVPRRMILQEVNEVLREYGGEYGCEVIISIPEGKKVADRTLNARLGIVGGLSILGTTGLVIPYSEKAFCKSLRCFLEMARSSGSRKVVLAGGRRSERCARRHLGWPEECYVLVGDYFGEGLKICAELNFQMVSIWAMPAKMLKLAAGHTNTHWTAGCDSAEIFKAFLHSTFPHRIDLSDHGPFRSVSFMLQYLGTREKMKVFETVCNIAAQNCFRTAGEKVGVQCHVVDEKGELLASSKVVDVGSTEAGKVIDPVSYYRCGHPGKEDITP
jgi:cobalt-precorrin-5B (C1)-methyltransferase